MRIAVDIQQTMSELTALPVSDRLRIVESLWNSIESEPVAVSPEQLEEIRRRVEAHERDPSVVLTWEQVLDQLRNRA